MTAKQWRAHNSWKNGNMRCYVAPVFDEAFKEIAKDSKSGVLRSGK